MTVLTVLSGLVLLGTTAFVTLRRRFLIVGVAGDSMLPTYADGDRVLVRRLRSSRGLRPGQVVVADLPPFGIHESGARPGTLAAGPPGPRPGHATAEVAGQVVKRVAEVSTAPAVAQRRRPVRTVTLLGDNPELSIDSRHYGNVPAEHVVGTVLRRL